MFEKVVFLPNWLYLSIARSLSFTTRLKGWSDCSGGMVSTFEAGPKSVTNSSHQYRRCNSKCMLHPTPIPAPPNDGSLAAKSLFLNANGTNGLCFSSFLPFILGTAHPRKTTCSKPSKKKPHTFFSMCGRAPTRLNQPTLSLHHECFGGPHTFPFAPAMAFVCL